MSTSLGLIGKPVTIETVSLWQLASEMCGVLAVIELQGMTLEGDSIKFDPVEFDGINYRQISALVWYDSNRKPTDIIRRVCEPSEMSATHGDNSFCISPCFIFEGEHCPEQPQVDTMAELCIDPCQRWADLEYICLQAASGQITSGLSFDSKSQNFSKPDIELLREKTEEYKQLCLKCNPCFKPEMSRRLRCSPVGKILGYGAC
jgi:hypothetical protein